MSTLRTNNIESLDGKSLATVEDLATINQRNIYVGSVAELVGLSAPGSHYYYETTSYHPGWDATSKGPVGGQAFVYDPFRSKTDHDGGLVIDPDKEWPDWSVNSEIVTWFTPATTGSGCYVAIDQSVFDVTKYGAKGDGVTNDNDSFHFAAQALNNRGTGHYLVPASENPYIVFKQEKDGSEVYKAVREPIGINNCSEVYVELNAKIKAADGLRYGAFDPTTGDPHNAPSGGFTNNNYASDIGSLLAIRGCENVSVNHINFDGNSTNYVVGGYWGSEGIQLDATGLRLDGTTNLTILGGGLTTRFGLDGIYVRANDSVDRTNIVINDVVSSMNGRQGMSITGGTYMWFHNCNFNDTGKGAVSSAPAAGVDIESNTQQINNIYFDGCLFTNNNGPAALILVPAVTKDIYFRNSILHGTTKESLWDEASSEFEDCTIAGGISNCKGSQFYKCLFTDRILPKLVDTYTGAVWRNGDADTYAQDCTFELVRAASSEIVISNDLTLRNCNYYVRLTDPALRSRVGIIRPIFANDFNIIAEYTFTAGNTGVDVSGEHTFIDTSGVDRFVDYKGLSELQGNGNLAWGGRAGLTYLFIPQVDESGPANKYKYFTGHSVTTRNVFINDTANFVDVLEIPLASSAKITIGGTESATGPRGIHLSEHFISCSGNEGHHGISEIHINEGNSLEVKWKGPTSGTTVDSRTLQLRNGYVSSNAYQIKVELFTGSGDVTYLL